MGSSKLNKPIPGSSLLVGIVALGGLVWLISVANEPTRQAAQPSRATKSPNQHPSTFMPGSTILLDSGSEHVVVYTSLDNLKEFNRLSVANDKLGMSAMLVDGRIEYVDPGTSALVLEIHPWQSAYSVRLQTEGQAGREVIVRSTNTKKHE